MYQRIDGTHWRHIWVVGDLHGCYHELLGKLRQRRFSPFDDLLISVGDLIDRGPDSLQCLMLLDKRWFKAVRGNHEQMALEALENDDMSLWQVNGGNWLADLSPGQREEAAQRLRGCDTLPWIMEVHCRNGVHIIAHADYPDSHYQWHKPVDRQQVLWSRQRLSAMARKQEKGISGADHFWFGHTPLRQPLTVSNLHYIDTGAVFGGVLTLAQLQ